MALGKSGGLDAERSKRLFELLGDLLRVGGGADMGHMEFLDVSAVAERLGTAEAPGRLDALNAVAHAVLSEQIQPPHMFFQQHDTKFAVIFVDSDATAAAAASEACGALILERLEKEHGLAGFDAAIEVKKLTFEELIAAPQELLPALDDVEALAAAHPKAVAPEPEPSERMDIRCRPLWRASNSAVGVFMMTLRKTDAGGGADRGYSVLPGKGDLRKLAAFDKSMINYSEQAIEAGVAAGEKFAVATPIYYESFQNPNLSSIYRSRIEALPAAVRRRLMFQVVGVNSRVDGRLLVVNLNYLAGMCQSVMVQLPLAPEGFIALKGAQVGAVGTSVYGEDPAGGEVGAKLRNFVRATASYRVPLYLTSVQSESVACQAIDLGFELLAGDFVGPDLPRPHNVVVREFDRLGVAPPADAAA